ncbi:MAG: hypothetical protein PWQ37_2624 [Candidatus Petromonas sp.]|jgi:hypothetical protein|nr:hypothetical protein [Candidatus Petromonas sp.]
MKVNRSIGCEVDECRFHAKTQQYCSLDNIKVVKHHGEARTVEATDCGSFEAENR